MQECNSYCMFLKVLDEPVTHLRMLMLALTSTLADCWLAAGRSGKIRLTLKKSFQEKEPLYFLEINYHKTPIKGALLVYLFQSCKLGPVFQGLDAPNLDPAHESDRDKAHIVSLSADGCVAVHKVFFGQKKTLCEVRSFGAFFAAFIIGLLFVL